MPEPQRKSDLMELLELQRRRVLERAGLLRGSAEWEAASEEMDALNRLIVRRAEGMPAGDDPVGMGVELDLDSRPSQDLVFRRRVVGSVRRAIVATTPRVERLAIRTGSSLRLSEQPMARTEELVERVELDLRRSYPWLVIASARVAPADPDLEILSMVALRDGDAA